MGNAMTDFLIAVEEGQHCLRVHLRQFWQVQLFHCGGEEVPHSRGAAGDQRMEPQSVVRRKGCSNPGGMEDFACLITYDLFHRSTYVLSSVVQA